MSLKLPQPINSYFEADKLSGTIFANCFTEDAILKDEGEKIKGRVAIEKWKDKVSLKYQYTTKPFAIDVQSEKYIVLSHVEGNFPNSPIDLRYTFALQGDKISLLEITL